MKNGWKSKPLGEACLFIDYRGRTPEKVESGLRLITAKNVKMGFLQTDPLEFVRPEIYDSWMTRGIPKIGDVIFTTEAPLANVAQLDTDERVVFAQRIIVLQPPTSELNPTFLKYQLLSDEAQKRIHEKGTGATVKGIKAKLLKTVEIAMPPLSEQRRIVGILDEAFAGIATAKAHAEKNLQNARALFESHLNAVFTQRGEGWDTQPLLSLCSLFVDSAHRTPKYQDDGIPALRPRDVVNGKLDLSGARCVSKLEYAIQSKRHEPEPGDVVYSRELSYGWAAMLPKSPRVCLSQGMCIFRPNGDLNGKFLLYVLNGPVGREQAHQAAVGAAHPHINLGAIKSYQIPFPPLKVQTQIVKEFDVIAEETQRLESFYRRKLAALDELKKSLLHQAFSGEL